MNFPLLNRWDFTHKEHTPQQHHPWVGTEPEDVKWKTSKNTFKIRSLSDINDITYASYTFYPSTIPMFLAMTIAFKSPASSGRKSLTPRAFNKPLAFNLARYRENDLGQPEKKNDALPALPLQVAPPDPQRPKKVIALPGVARLQSNHWASQQALWMGASGYNQQINVTNPGKWPAKELSRKNPKVSWQLASFGNFSDSTVFQIKTEEPLQCKQQRRKSLNIP